MNDNNNIPVLNEAFCDSPEAMCWFGHGGKDKNVKETMASIIKKLRNAYIKVDSWRNIVSYGAQKDICTNDNIHMLCSKAMYLAIALQLALDHMPTKTWKEYCNEAINHVMAFNEILGGVDDDNIMATKYNGTIQRWLRNWKANNHCFPNPYFVQNGKVHLPQLLDN